MQEILLKIRYFERESSKSLKKVDFIFLSDSVPPNGQSYQKQKGHVEQVTSHFSGYKTSSEKFLY